MQWPGFSTWDGLGTACGITALAFALRFAIPAGAVGDMRLMEAAVASHNRATASAHLVQVASSDGATLQPWLRDRLAFTPPVALPPGMSAELIGARADSLDSRPVAAVVYRVRDHVVHAFVWPEEGESVVSTASLEGVSVWRWSGGGMRYCVVSGMPEAQLLAFAQSLAIADANP